MSQNCLKIGRDKYKKMNKFRITYGTVSTEFGPCFMALHAERICFLKFLNGSSSCLDDLVRVFPGAELTQEDELMTGIAEHLFDDNYNSKIMLKGTDFEMTVWQELLNIKKGTTCCYEDIAKAIGNPRAIRAVANAIARNNVSYLIPCHRVISKDGSLNKYGGGVQRKLQLLRHEKAM